MKIKRFTAKNMREAIRQVREEQGPDAVILSNRRVPEGIEVVAATDYDAALIQQALRNDDQTETTIVPAPERPLPREIAASTVFTPPATAITPRAEPPRIAAEAAIPAAAARIPVAAPTVTTVLRSAGAEDSSYQDLRRELNSMRSMLENQLNGLVWEQMRSKQPRRVAVLRSLMNLSITPVLAREIAAELPQDASDDQARYLPLGALARRIPATKPDPIMEGGVVALVGATGVGKTTTIAKLAARYAARHGTRDLAVVSTDCYRVGAQEQLHTYGRLLGVPVHTANGAEQLGQILQRLADRKLVLIDTAGMAPRDEKLSAQLEALTKAGNVRSFLVLPASSQTGDLDQAVQRFGAAPLSGCILTKLDEATRIGGALSTVIRRHVPVAYFCDGQRVPEDLHLARPYHLVVRAQHLAQQTPASLDDETMALQFGAAHAA